MKTISRFLILLVVSACWIPAHSQLLKAKKPVSKNALQLGDQYFAAGEYYTAAHLYGQYLNPSKKQKETSEFPLNVKARRNAVAGSSAARVEVLYKQAESYRLANYWQEAAAVYKECLDANPGKYGDALYWLAVCERSLGQYDSAKQNLEQYLTTIDEKNQYYTPAKTELQTLEFIRQQLSRADSVLFTVKKLEVPNSNEKGAFAPSRIGDNRYLVSSTVADSAQINGVNPYHSRLFIVTLGDGGIATIEPVSLPAADAAINQGAGTLSADGKHLYFSQWKKDKGQTVSSIYHSVKQDNGWSEPVLASINANGSNSKQPFCSADGKHLFFASDRPGGSGGFDIWYAPMKEDGTTGQPINAGIMINSKADEQAPFYHNSTNILVFSSNGRQSMGGYDLYAAKGNEMVWQAPDNMGHPVNSPKDDIYFFAPEQSALLSNAIVSSDRGSGCCLESYSIVKAPKNKRLIGNIRDCDDNAPAPGATVILKAPSGQTWTSTTDVEGQFAFEIGPEAHGQLSLTIRKEHYLESATLIKPEKTDETDLLTDNLFVATICITKIPVDKPAEPEPIVIKVEDVVTIFFDFDRNVLKGDAKTKLDSIYQVMADDPAVTIQVSGYTDGLGSAKYNDKLSDKRARACADYLIKKGIAAGRVTFVSFGSCCPVEMELINGRDNPDGRSKNRRALINVKRN